MPTCHWIVPDNDNPLAEIAYAPDPPPPPPLVEATPPNPFPPALQQYAVALDVPPPEPLTKFGSSVARDCV
jgi:hypothetical protein